tara:strand:- start:202 stop:537 length:336 start_codon:yes stop_codon:yes gene_type:complete
MATKNLYTDGSEFKLPSGRRYRGYYHVHPTKGAMVGAAHVDRFHESLTPVNKIVKERMEGKNGVNPIAPPRPRVVSPPTNRQITPRPTTTRPATQRPTVTPTPSGGGGGGY